MEEKDKTVPTQPQQPQDTTESTPVATKPQQNGVVTTQKKDALTFKANPTRYITMTAMVTSLAFIVMIALRIKVGFLTIDAKDVVMTVSSFMFTPFIGLWAALLVPLVEMITVSDTLFWGMVMNMASSVAFVLTATLVYKKNRSLKGAIIGLVAAVIVMTVVMTIANIFVTPIYTKAPVEAVMKMLVPVIIPFNLLKGAINAAVIMLIYKPLVRSFRAANMLPTNIKAASEADKKKNLITLLVSIAVVALIIVLIIVWANSQGLNINVNPPK